jgi:single-strand DNA-binding protein
MTCVNRVFLIGYVGQDPKFRTASASGKKMAFLSLATTKRWRRGRDGERMEATHWHQVAVFDERLVEEIERTIKKGTHTLVEGELQYRQYKDDSGVERVAAEIVIQNFGGRVEPVRDDGAQPGMSGARPPLPEGPESYGGGSRPKAQPRPQAGDSDEVPF